MDYIQVSAKTVEDAVLEAAMKLATTRDHLEYEVIEKGSAGFLGFGAKNAVIKARALSDEEIEKKAAPSAALTGTYEEMFSNWRNKVEEAWNNDDNFASFMNMSSLHLMLSDISAEVDIGEFPVMEDYDPERLEANVRTFDANLERYEHVYTRAGIQVKRYADVHEFAENY